MSDISELYDRTSSPHAFLKGYTELLSSRLQGLNYATLESLIEQLIRTRDRDGVIYLAGNGGSAATAMHWANDLMSITTEKRFKALALASNTSVLTCIGNDTTFERIFADQLEGRITPHDTLVLLSASGNSPNLLAAAEIALAQHAAVTALVGFDGGQLKKLVSLPIHTETSIGDYGIVEDIHLAIAHMVSNYLRHTK